jgi:bifunctional non-homologous end joining protein LigD
MARSHRCSPARELPAGDGWVLEPKWDGIRAIAHVTERGPRLFTRHGRGHHHRFPRINAALAELPLGTVLDGELVCLQPLEDGRVRRRFDRVSAFIVARSPHRPDANGLTVTLIVFDALRSPGRTCAQSRGLSGALASRSRWMKPTARCA